MRVLAVLVLTACGRIGFDGSTTGGGDALVVTIPMDRMAGTPTLAAVDELPAGTVGLSLREAVTIAANRPGADAVTFDPAVFPAAAPVAIPLGSSLTVAAGTTIDATGAGVALASMGGFTLVEATDDVVLDGFELDGGDIGVHAVGAGLVARNLHFRASTNEAILADGVTNATIEDSRVDNAGPAPIRLVNARDSTVQRTFVALASKTGVVYGIRVETSTAIHILDNTVDPGTAWMISLDTTTDSEVIGNIVDGADTGIALINAQRTYVFRNVVIAPSTDSVYLDPASSDNQVVNNTFFMCDVITIDGATNTTDTNNLVSATASDFVDPTTYDFHLVAGSTSIDTAADVGQDMLPDQPARFLGAGPDLGAVESY